MARGLNRFTRPKNLAPDGAGVIKPRRCHHAEAPAQGGKAGKSAPLTSPETLAGAARRRRSRHHPRPLPKRTPNDAEGGVGAAFRPLPALRWRTPPASRCTRPLGSKCWTCIATSAQRTSPGTTWAMAQELSALVLRECLGPALRPGGALSRLLSTPTHQVSKNVLDILDPFAFLFCRHLRRLLPPLEDPPGRQD